MSISRDEIAAYLRHVAASKSVGGHKLRPVLVQAADEIDRLLAALKIAAKHVNASYQAEHMMDGFGPVRPRRSDSDYVTVMEAINQSGTPVSANDQT